MDAWMQAPGARVVGHHAVVRGEEAWSYVACTCGFRSQASASVDRSCVVLADHLQVSVRGGARVVYPEGGGEAGVREPRRPLHPLGSLSVALRLDDIDRTA